MLISIWNRKGKTGESRWRKAMGLKQNLLWLPGCRRQVIYCLN